MFTVAAPFWSRPGGGDGLTRLRCVFAGGSTADVSGYGVPDTIVEASGTRVQTTDGELSILVLGPEENTVSWSSNDLGRQPNTGHTIEFFAKAAENNLNVTAALRFVALSMLNMNNSECWINGHSGGINPLEIRATTYYTWTDTVDAFATRMGTYKHFAFVCDASTNGDLRVYVDGTLRATYNTGSLQKTVPYSGSVQFGSLTGGVTGSTFFYFSGVRVRRAEMYTGSSFTPPASPAAWGTL